MPSTQTRSKLKAFQFIEGAPSRETRKGQEAEKENAHINPRRRNETPKRSKATKDMDQNVSETPKLVHAKTCPLPPPSTPATRLPLADLVGNIDDSNRHLMQAMVSPDEQLGWRGSQPVNTPIPRKKKKRARSSSPVAPSQDEPRMDLIRRDLNTTQPDPATELWTRYTSNKGTPTAGKNVAFAHLIHESSPRSSATAGSVSGLRRWASCGVEFPASHTKKRRTKGTFRTEKEPPGDVFGPASSDGAFHAQPEQSKLAGMLQRMRDSITRQEPSKACPSELPSSSSPLPEVRDRYFAPESSPLRHHALHESAQSSQIMEAELEVIEEVIEEVVEEEEAPVELPGSSYSSDEFGDADFDTEMIEEFEISQQPPPQPDTHAPLPAPPVDSAHQLPLQSANFAIDDDGSDDEFGIDEDLFAADLEQVASLYDVRPEATSTETQNISVQDPNNDTVVYTTAPPVISLVDDDSDDFGDDIDVDEFAAAEVAATQSGSNSQQTAKAIQRYLIKTVEEGFYTTDRGYRMPEKVLSVEEEKSKTYKAITLRQAWYDTPCAPGAFVHVIGEFDSSGLCLIDEKSNMLILHPDHLISATVVADSFGCLRRAVLQDRIKATSKANAPMLYGTLLHELFQEAIKVNQWDTEFLLETIDKLLPGKYETILEIASTCEQVKEHMHSKLPELQAWAEVFVRAEPRQDAIVRERNGKQSIMSINKLLDIEEHVWSPMYGLKGNIDATVQVTMQDDFGERTLIVPFEVKTGKNSSSAAHVAQTALYNLLLSNRYDVDVAYGILYYLETSDISRIPAIRNDIIHMIIKRNELACYVRDRIELPPVLKEDFKCQKCYAQEACFLYDKLVEDGDGELLNKKAKERYDELTQSLNSTDQQFMKKWDTLLTKEESDMMKFRRELWTMLSTEREKLGRCFSNVILEPGSVHEEKNGQKINRYSYTFIKQKPNPGFSFTDSQMIIGEPVVVSDEQGHFALANGYVTNVRKHRITVAVDRRLHNARTKLPGFNSQTNQTFVGIMEVTKEGEQPLKAPVDDEPILYRLDKDEFSNGMAAARNNLIQIMDDSVHKARELRSLIVQDRPPVFKPVPNNIIWSSSQMSMNSDQKAAVAKVMSAKDYALVLGMPGTGKTTTIAHIIRALVAKGKSVLLTSYTHSAVDNILLKIRNDGIGILRLGAAAKVHPEVRQFATLGSEPKDSIEELEKSWMEPLVVATTCLTINHPLFNRRVFDYCIVDEASQITLPVCLGPIRMANTFVLVGDHYQLPPLVQNKEACEGGLDVSLFKLLCEAHPEAVVSLEHQYRMCDEIMLLSNTFIYSGRLKCGTAAVASRRLVHSNPTGLATYHRKQRSNGSYINEICATPSSPNCWLSKALDAANPVIFINTDAISTSLESASGSRITNALEARLVAQLTVSLLALGVPATEIGVIAFYRSQLALLRSTLQATHTQTQSSELAAPVGSGVGGVELHTADRFQGRDKEVVLVSCVRSNENGVIGDLLKDRRRINVAITRARSKLVILGSERTLSSNELLRDLVQMCKEKGWALNLQQDMLDGHAFDEAFSQSQAPSRLACSPLAAKSPSPMLMPMPWGSPSKKRRALGDVTAKGANAGAAKPFRYSPEKRGLKKPFKVPMKVIKPGMKGLLEGRPVLSNVFREAM